MGSACSSCGKDGAVISPSIFRDMSSSSLAGGTKSAHKTNNVNNAADGGGGVAGDVENDQNKDFIIHQALNELDEPKSASKQTQIDDLLEQNDQNKNRRGSIEMLNNSISYNTAFDLDFLKQFPDNMLYEAHCAQRGHLDAQMSLGMAYDKGTRGLDVNTSEAMRWYTLAADRGDLDAQMALAELCSTGHHDRFEASQALGFKYYKLAADNGNAEAQFNAARLVLSEPSKLNDVSQALRYLRQSERQGFTKAQACYGTLLLEGKIVEMDIRRGVRLLKRAALESDYVALHNLSFIYRLGLGVFQDRDQSRAYAELASFAHRGNFENDLAVSSGLINYF